MDGIARLRALTATAFMFACVCAPLVSAGAAPARPSRALKTVRYHGITMHIPRSWPVVDLAREPQACVRFDRHALYLGTPGGEERCPAHAVGRTDAILISPLGGHRGAPSTTTSGLQLQGDATSFSVRSAGVEVTATWSRGPQAVSRALGLKSLPAPDQRPARTSGSAAAGMSATPEQRGTSSKGSSIYTGRGFDTCTTPSKSQMSAWSSSPYRAVGVYIGGLNEACAQPNLNKGWISHEFAAGWHLFPIWVGLQAPVNRCGCHGISTNTRTAHAQGRRAAGAAVAQAKRLGILAGNPIYNDIEGYTTGSPNTAAVLAYLSGWTSKLHAAGYIAGAYGGATSTISDLATRYHQRYAEPDDIWFAEWNGQKTAHSSFIPSSDWSHHQRSHQYLGGHDESYGGVTLNIDDDFVNGATASRRNVRAVRNGYMLLTSNGGIHRFGRIAGYGSAAGKLPSGVTAVALAQDRKTDGYWILSSDGAVRAFHAPSHGSLKNNLGGAVPVALAGSRTGGYLLLTSNGAVHRFGPIKWHGGDAGKLPVGVSAVGLARDPKTGGYWILRSDGGVDGFHAPTYGSLKNKSSGADAVALAAAQGGGYFILTSSGGVHHFGSAKSYGSDAGKLPSGVTAVSLATSTSAPGYRILRSDGGVNCFGAKWYGSLFGKLPAGASPVMIADAMG